MAKLLLVIAVFIVVYLFLRSYRRATIDKSAPPRSAAEQGQRSKHGEDMVRCRICGVHLPKSESSPRAARSSAARSISSCAARERDGR